MSPRDPLRMGHKTHLFGHERTLARVAFCSVNLSVFRGKKNSDLVDCAGLMKIGKVPLSTYLKHSVILNLDLHFFLLQSWKICLEHVCLRRLFPVHSRVHDG
ncbi:hypothetical protein RJ641_008759 [Dillenia turbinata]|uniref:Uncharacterized protein n=1 Tax=Dillenia turbinata TaxID=194707 RepID=A0AAN8V3V3_9MAGN